MLVASSATGFSFRKEDKMNKMLTKDPLIYTTAPLVFIISPWQNGTPRNRRYLREAVAYCFAQGFAPIAPHGFYPQYLDDKDSDQRIVGIACGHKLLEAADFGLVFGDLGLSVGMYQDIGIASDLHKKLEWIYIRKHRGVKSGAGSKHG